MSLALFKLVDLDLNFYLYIKLQRILFVFCKLAKQASRYGKLEINKEYFTKQ